MITKLFFLSLISLTACHQTDVINTASVEAAASVEPVSVGAPPQRQGFITVEGANLKARLDAAVRQGRAASPAARFWTAYAFDVRPGIAVDVEFKGHHNVTNVVGGTSVSFGSQVETRNLGVFFLHEPDGSAITRVEVYNLERQREYSGYRVFWLGRGGNEESLSLLQTLTAANQPAKVAEHAVFAIAVHDDPRVGGLLKEFVRQSSVVKVRSSAVFWLGQVGGETAFLSELIRNTNENVGVRKQAAFAIGVSKDQAALTTLQNLYGSVTDREVKKQIIFAVSINETNDAAANFLIDTARNDADREARKQAIFWLGQKASKRSLDALGDTVDSNDADTEVQKQAVFAISQRSKDEAVPLLIKIAKTHQKAAVRKQAIFWLGQTGDERAVDFFKEVLLK